MGTTVTAAYVGEHEVTIAHVGDSRAYVLRGGELDPPHARPLARRRAGRPRQAHRGAGRAHPQRSVITRALGPEPECRSTCTTYQARAGDLFLVCSDGLTSMVREARVKAILEAAGSLEQAGRDLIAAANEAGGRDNITVILFRLEEVDGGGATAAERRRRRREYATGRATRRGEALQGATRPDVAGAPPRSPSAEARDGAAAARPRAAAARPPPPPRRRRRRPRRR